MRKLVPRLYIFDLDSTLWDGIKLYEDALDILKKLRKDGHYVYLASFNRNAPEYLEALNIKKYFHGGAFGYIPMMTKSQMVNECIDHVRKHYDGTLENIEFYDDLLSNITDVQDKLEGKVKAVYVENGITWDHIDD